MGVGGGPWSQAARQTHIYTFTHKFFYKNLAQGHTQEGHTQNPRGSHPREGSAGAGLGLLVRPARPAGDRSRAESTRRIPPRRGRVPGSYIRVRVRACTR